MLGDIDPYFILDEARCSREPQGLEWQNCPNVLYADIYNYFIVTPSYTKEELKAYKSLEGYKWLMGQWHYCIAFTISS